MTEAQTDDLLLELQDQLESTEEEKERLLILGLMGFVLARYSYPQSKSKQGDSYE